MTGRIGLSPFEAETLRSALTSYRSDLGREIADTDRTTVRTDFRERLESREVVLEDLLA